MGEVGKARSGVGFPDVEQGGTSGTPFFKVSDMNNDGNENEMNVANNYVTDAQITARRWSPIEEVPAIFFAKVGAAVMLNRKRLCRFPFLLDNNTMAYSLGKGHTSGNSTTLSPFISGMSICLFWLALTMLLFGDSVSYQALWNALPERTWIWNQHCR